MHQKQTPVIWMVTAITDDTEARKKKGRKKKKKRLRNQSALRKGEHRTAFWIHWNNEQIYDYTIESRITEAVRCAPSQI